MTARGKLIVIKGDNAYDMSDLVSTVTWSGRKGSSSRTLQVNFLDDDGYKHDRTNIDVTEGYQCIFYWDNTEIFRGIFMSQSQSGKKSMTAKAYDIGIYLANNKDSFNYTNKKASEIFVDVCKRFDIPYGGVADTSYKIPELPKPRTTAWDVITDALSLTFNAKGVRYYPVCKGDELSLIERRENIIQWVIETGVNLFDYTQSKSIEKVKTRIRILSKENKILAEAKDENLEKKIGIFQDVISSKDDMNKAQLTELVNTTLEENNPTNNLSLSALGLPEVITGVGVFITINPLNISRTYYVEEDTHTFDGQHHTMTLKLSIAGDLEKDNGNNGGSVGVGDIVNFAGGSHFVSSAAGSPTGGTRRAGPAKCTLVAKGAKHPYHLIGGSYTNVEGNSNVYGWVDENLIKK